MITHKNKIIASVSLGFFSFIFLLFGVFIIVTTKNPLGFLFILATLGGISAIAGIFKERKIFLAIGLFFTLLLIIDGISSIFNKYILDADISISFQVVVALANIYPVMIISKTLRKISHDKTK